MVSAVKMGAEGNRSWRDWALRSATSQTNEDGSPRKMTCASSKSGGLCSNGTEKKLNMSRLRGDCEPRIGCGLPRWLSCVYFFLERWVSFEFWVTQMGELQAAWPFAWTMRK